jgi:hypothetical protein
MRSFVVARAAGDRGRIGNRLSSRSGTSHALTLLAGAIAALAMLVAPARTNAAAYAAPDPGGDESAHVPLPPPGKALGFNESVWGVADEVSPADFVEIVATAGGNVIRTNLDWRHAEPARDLWSPVWWSRWRQLYDAALARGVTPLFIIGMAPPWAWEERQADCDELRPLFGGCELPPADTEAMNEEWAEYSAEVAHRFPRAMIEVWNEPNLTAFWETGADPARFAELQVAAHEAIEAESPMTQVISGGLVNVLVSDAAGMRADEFLDGAYAASPSIAGHMDAIGIHPYPYDDGFGADTLFALSLQQVRGARSLHGDAATPLFLTEVGVSTGPPELHSEEQRAGASLRLYRRAMTMPDVAGVVLHRLVEQRGANPWELGSAWLRNGGPPLEPKPVYCTFVQQAGNSYPLCPPGSAVDIDPPQTRIANGPAAVRTRRPGFRFAASEPGASFECSLDLRRFRPCSRHWRVPRMRAGRHLLQVAAADREGNLDQSPARRGFLVARPGSGEAELQPVAISERPLISGG